MKKKGFTLIELLAVIVILAIIALIAVPVIMNIISSARKSAFEDTAYGLISSGEMYYASALLNDGMSGDTEFVIENGAFAGENKLDVKGSLPGSGKIKVTKEGKVAIAITNGKMCITKGYDDSKIKLEEEFETCELPAGAPAPGSLAYLAKTNDFATSVDACATSGVCQPGTPFAIEVAPGIIQNFYVISDVNNEVTLIMDRNVNETTVAWMSHKDYGCEDGVYCSKNDKGPLTALNYLESQTSGWTNIESKDYTIIEEGYDEITSQNSKARMISALELQNLGCTAQVNTCPSWIYDGLSGSAQGYWTTTINLSFPWEAFVVRKSGYLDPTDGFVDESTLFGVRPVIELSK